MSLRPYQLQGMSLLQESFRKGHKRVIRCAPTGSGKSLEMAEMTRRAYEKGRRVIILTHRMELFKSTLSHLGRAGIPCVELNAGADMPAGDWRVMLAMEKTIWNRIVKAPDSVLRPDLIVADEIHFQNFSKIINHFSDSYLIGFSATPQGKHIHTIYTDIVQNVDVPDLVVSGYLARCWAREMQDDFSDVKISKGEFEDASLFKHFDTAKLYAGIIDKYREQLDGEKGIVFCCNIKHVENTFSIFKEAGVNAFMVHSGMSNDERNRNVQEFENSTDGVMINNGILTTGFDCPSIAFVILYRATTSLPLFLQMIGRGSRPYPGKSLFKVIDFGGNHSRHGIWNQPRTWTLDPPKKRKKIQAAPSKNCPSCGAFLYASVRVCEFCKYEFPKPTHEEKNGVLVEVDSIVPLGLTGKRISELTTKELIACQTTGRIKPSYVWRVLRSKEVVSPGTLDEYAKQKGYKNGWLYTQREKLDDPAQIGFKDYILR